MPHLAKHALWALSIFFLFSCSERKLVTDDHYLREIEKSFEERKELAASRQEELFGVFDNNLPADEETALKFLYAYMPLSDLADYNGVFFLENARKALESRSKVPWGDDIPGEIFLHYVLPVRVNNENLDSFRLKCYDEIHQRIEGLGIKDAALEINYWCQEKVSYQPADSRTSAPLSTMLSARGRCGEESTFTVAALRTAGIPARQVYTPRWAHSDDNHAWVEVYIDGEWFYMGACEPEPVLDRGWFTEPARRAMLVHTKSFGAPTGKENAIVNARNYTEVNNLAKYADTKKIFVSVSDREGDAVAGASVEFRLYNYAEFYPIATVLSDDNGISSFETGFGDLLIWVSKDELFDWEKISVRETDTVFLKIEDRNESGSGIDLDLMIPPVKDPLPGPPPDLAEKNAARVRHGDSIRNRYIDSWMKPAEAAATGRKLGINAERAKTVISRSMGNYNEIRKFLAETPDSLRNLAVLMLEALPDKDLRDTKATVLLDHIMNTHAGNRGRHDRIFINYVLNPRISLEILSPWRSYFDEKLPAVFGSNRMSDPFILVKYLERNITIDDSANYYKTPLTPAGVFDLKVSDKASRAICFVAMCRSMGVPSRLEPSMNIPQFWSNGRWNNVFFEGEAPIADANAYLRLTTSQLRPVPEYYTHFTIARFDNGRYNTLEYDYNRKVTDFDELGLPAGKYMLVTGNRLDDRILAHVRFFELFAGDHLTLDIKTRTDTLRKEILGSVDMEGISGLFEQKDEILKNAGNGFVAAWIEPGLEPTRHVFNDLPVLKDELDAWGGSFLFLNVSEDSGSFDPSQLRGLPENSYFSADPGLKGFSEFVKTRKETTLSYPLIIQADSAGNITFVSSGYRIGIGDNILKNIR